MSPHRLVSGAGHDAGVMAAVAPMAMLFLRSPGGVSHHPDERVLAEDVAVGLAVSGAFSRPPGRPRRACRGNLSTSLDLGVA